MLRAVILDKKNHKNPSDLIPTVLLRLFNCRRRDYVRWGAPVIDFSNCVEARTDYMRMAYI